MPVIPGVLWKYLQFLPSAFIKHCHFDFLNIITAYVQCALCCSSKLPSSIRRRRHRCTFSQLLLFNSAHPCDKLMRIMFLYTPPPPPYIHMYALALVLRVAGVAKGCGWLAGCQLYIVR